MVDRSNPARVRQSCRGLATRSLLQAGYYAAGAFAMWLAAALLVSGQSKLPAASAEAGELERFSFQSRQMGSTVELVLYSADRRSANTAAEAVWARFGELNAIMSDYDPASELSRLSDTAGSGHKVPVSRDLWNVLAAAQSLSARSAGAFDITVGPYVKLWRRARREKQFPPAERLDAARQAVGYQWLILDPDTRTAELTQPSMRLDLGGIATGYACDEAMKLLAARGITRALIDASGDILAGDPPPGEQGWKIGIAPLANRDGPPSRYLILAHAAVTTSGDAWQYVELGGKRYSHIVDPHTGLGLTRRSSVTVVARDCIAADSLATAACVLGPVKGLALIEATPGAAALIAVIEDGEMRTYASSRLRAFNAVNAE